jgi:peptidoglycan hydrolase CwlO-like protein
MLGVCCHLQGAQKHSAQLQKQLDRKVTEVDLLQHKLTSLHAELGKTAKAKEVNAQISCM